MKTKLLSMFTLMLIGASSISAQTKVWDFTNDRATWPLSSGTGVSQTSIDNLGLFAYAEGNTPITNFATITASNQTFTDGFAGTHRFQMNGAGYSSGPFVAMPTQRFAYFNVTGSCTVKVWFKTGSNGATRTVYVSDGTAALGSGTSNNGTNGDSVIFTASYTGGAARLYIFGDTANNLYKIEVTGTTVTTPVPVLAANNFQTQDSVNVYALGSQIKVTNVISNSQINVYNVTGALVKSVSTDNDMSFELNQGLYFVTVKSNETEKSVKVIVQ